MGAARVRVPLKPTAALRINTLASLLTTAPPPPPAMPAKNCRESSVWPVLALGVIMGGRGRGGGGPAPPRVAGSYGRTPVSRASLSELKRASEAYHLIRVRVASF